MYTVTIKSPNTNTDIIKECKYSTDITDFINNTLFSGINITNNNIVYSLLSRPGKLKVPYKDLITIERSKPITKRKSNPDAQL